MSQEPLDYVQLTREGLRSVIARVMSHVAEHGLYGDQHLFVKFDTTWPGVVMPDWLLAQYPDEIGIVLQYEYSDLAVMNDRFSVVLSFGDRPAQIVVPLAAVKSFADPSVNFGLEIPLPDPDRERADALRKSPMRDSVSPRDDTSGNAEAEEGGETGTGTVVSLDAFRMK